MKRLSILFLGLVVTLFACKHYPDEFPQPNNPPIDTTGNPIDTTQEPEDTMVCFESDILPIFQTNCARTGGCHDAVSHEEDLRLYTYQGIMTGIQAYNPGQSEFMQVINSNGGDVMPPYPYTKLTPAQVALLNRWINQGAQNTTNCNKCDTATITFSAAIQPMMNTYCVGCHGNNSPGGGINLTTYGGVQAVANNGKLFGSMNHSTGYSAMPKSAAKLSNCKLTQVQKWIAAGALNN